VRQGPGDPPLRLHMIRALLERRKFLDEKAGVRMPDAPKTERREVLAKVLPFGEVREKAAGEAEGA
jgi:hypothetical protein